VKLRRGLAIRILVVALAIGGVSAVLGVVGGIEARRQAVTAMLAERWQRDLRERSVRECEEDPTSFGAYDETRLRLVGLDVRTGRSANPGVRAEDREHLAGLGAEPRRLWPPRPYYTAFLRGADSGPCSAFRATLEGPPALRRIALRSIATAVGLVTLAAGIFVLLIIVAPFRRRIARLRESAASVGADAYRNEERDARDELGDVARSIDVAHHRIREDHDALVASRAALERFLGDIAHDLRTPLTSLRLALEELADAELDEPAREALQAAFADAVYASSLAENLKLASRLEHRLDEGRPTTTMDLREVADRVATREAVFARRSGLELRAEVTGPPLLVDAHPVMVEQALSNVVQNAIIHGEGGGLIEIRLQAEADGFLFEVLDDGPGVPPAVLPRLGERAFRSDDARARDLKGSGLGLAITSEVCDRFGWLLKFEAREPRGLRVTVRG